jgi:hypothetical protein
MWRKTHRTQIDPRSGSPAMNMRCKLANRRPVLLVELLMTNLTRAAALSMVMSSLLVHRIHVTLGVPTSVPMTEGALEQGRFFDTKIFGRRFTMRLRVTSSREKLGSIATAKVPSPFFLTAQAGCISFDRWRDPFFSVNMQQLSRGLVGTRYTLPSDATCESARQIQP